MNARAKTRNVDLVRNILHDELVNHYSLEYWEHQEPVILNDVLEGATAYHLIARRLQVKMPKGQKMVGAVVARAHAHFLEGMKNQREAEDL